LSLLEQGKSPVDGYSIGRAPGGRVTVRGMPHTIFDRLLLSGFSAEVWMPPGVDENTVRSRAGLAELDPAGTHGIGAVLGAGNVTAIAPLDVIYELYAQNRVVALKLNPITNPLLDVLEKIFEPFLALGVLRILTGAADVGSYLVDHPKVGHVHMTGSAATHDAVVFGTGPEGARRKAENRPVLTKEITSELGGVSPTIVLPGRWAKADLKFQAEHVATQRLHNGGYNCVASQVLVLSSDWAQKDEFLAALRSALAAAPSRPAYYPGSDQRVQDTLAAYPDAERLGPGGGRLLVTGLRRRHHPAAPARSAGSTDSAGSARSAASAGLLDDENLLAVEAFAPVLGVLELPGRDLDFLETAISTVNDDLAGTLGVNLIAHPRTLRQLGDAFEAALVRLRYGTIAVNAWTGVGFATATASWGAFPGHTVEDVQSGIGVVHNTLLLENPERTVIRGPFRSSPRSLLHGEPSISPKPPWFVSNRTATGTCRAMTAFAASPSWSKLPKIFASALRG
jgi:aldehyde dehydrogenase (NAD(P)+)